MTMPNEQDGAANAAAGPDAPASPFKSALERPQPWQRVIKVEIERAFYDKEYTRLLHGARRQMVMPGFRRGRVPVAVVAKELQAELRSQTLETVIPQAYRAAMVEHSIAPVNDPEIGGLKLEEGQPVTFQITVEVRPELTARDYDGLPLVRRRAAVADADVDGVVERLRHGRVVHERVERPAAADDLVVIDLVPLDVAGEPLADKRVEGYEYPLGAEGNIESFETALLGTSAGERRRVTVEYPPDHFNAELRGTTMTYDIDVREVRRRLLPDVDDAFASHLKPGQTLLELRGTIRSELQSQAEGELRRELEDQVIDGLLERNEVMVPPSLIDQYVSAGLEELHGRNHQRGREVTPEEETQYREITRPIAERVLKGMFVMEAIRRQEGIEIGEAEVEARIAEIAREYGFDLEKYREYAARQEERNRIVHSLEERKTFDFLLSRAAFREEPVNAAEGGALRGAAG